MAADLSVTIRRLVSAELPRLKDRVRETSAWTAEGLRARAAPLKLFRRLKALAEATGNAEVKLGVYQLVATFKSDLPNYDGGGSVN